MTADGYGILWGGDDNVLELVAMAARLCECAGNAALYSLKGCTWWCGSDFSIKLFKKHPCLSLLAGLQLLDLWSPATVAGPQGVPLPVLLAVLDSVVSLRFCPNTCRSCHVQSARGPSWGQSSGLHLKRRGPGLALQHDAAV